MDAKITTKKDSDGKMYEIWTFPNKHQETIYSETGHEILKICSLFGFEVMNYKHFKHILFNIIPTKDERGNYKFINLKN